MNICIKKYSEEIPADILDSISSISTFLTSYFTRVELSEGLISFCLELHDMSFDECEITLLVSDVTKDICRTEKYENCIYSHYADRRGELILINNVKGREGYLELDDRVNSEIFVEFSLSNDYNIILNAEFEDNAISKNTRNWFNLVSDLIRKNFIK